MAIAEAHLDTHDVSFQVSGQAEPDATFRLLLLSTQEASLGDDSKRIERLSVVSGGRNIAIVLLLTGDDAMTAFSNLQVEYVSHEPRKLRTLTSVGLLSMALKCQLYQSLQAQT